MSTVVDEVEARLAELQGERAALVAARTQDDAERAAKEYADTVRRRHAELGGFVLGGAIVGDPLQSVLTAFIVSRPDFESWLVEQAKAVCGELSDRQKTQTMSKLDKAIVEKTAELREARKQEAFERIEAEFAGEAA
jgi:flavin-dependent dehydrogenase